MSYPMLVLTLDRNGATGTRRLAKESGATALDQRPGSMLFDMVAMGIDRLSEPMQWSVYARAEWIDGSLGNYVAGFWLGTRIIPPPRTISRRLVPASYRTLRAGNGRAGFRVAPGRNGPIQPRGQDR